MRICPSKITRVIYASFVVFLVAASAMAQKTASTASVPDDDTEAIHQVSKRLVDTFNAKDVTGFEDLFMPDAELIDDAGNLHLGRDAIQSLFASFAELFPDAEMKLEIESVRLAAGQLGVENGSRTIISVNIEIKGQVVATSETLVLESADQGSMVAKVKSKGPDEFQFTVAGSPPNDEGLKFRRVRNDVGGSPRAVSAIALVRF